MKIVPHIPKSILSETNNDSSRLGNKVQAIRLEELQSLPHGIVIFGIADDSGIKNVGGRQGANHAPWAIRDRLYRFTAPDFHGLVYDLGDLLPSSSIESTHSQATEIILQIHQHGHIPVILGGGHDLAYPQALALCQFHSTKSLGFLNIDAHLDLRSTKKGVTSGSPWFLLLENPIFTLNRSTLVEFGIQAHCNSQELLDYAKQHSVTIHWLSELRKTHNSALSTYKRVIQKLEKKKSVYVSLDIDAVRSSEAPGCSAPQTLGFAAAEVIDMSFHAGEQIFVHSFGIFEVSPPLDVDKKTASLAAHCIYAFLRGTQARKRAKIKKWPTKRKAPNKKKS